jgi:hypothetical protein
LIKIGQTSLTKVDYGMDSLSAPMHKCGKIWFMYPPPEKNLSLMAKEDGEVVKMVRLAQSLEGGVMFYISSEIAVYILSGCIHAVLTVSGGYLVTMDFTTRNSMLPFSRYLDLQLYTSLDQEGQRDCYYMYLDCLGVALANGRHEMALKRWISAGDHLKQKAKKDRAWEAAAVTYWSSFLSTTRSDTTIYPCGFGCLEGGFTEHFQHTHLKFLDPEAGHRRGRCHII